MSHTSSLRTSTLTTIFPHPKVSVKFIEQSINEGNAYFSELAYEIILGCSFDAVQIWNTILTQVSMQYDEVCRGGYISTLKILIIYD